MTIAVFGATGHLGKLIIDALQNKGVEAGDIRALGRKQEKLAAFAEQNIETAAVELNDPASVEAAISGTDTVVLVSSSDLANRVTQHRNVIDAAKKLGVTHVLYTSAPKATTSALVLAPDHKATEEYLAASGLNTTILRNGWYTENYVSDFEQARNTGALASSVGEGRVASAPRADYAEAAAVVATTPGHDGQIYELSGDAAWSPAEFASTASEVLGKPVTYTEISPEEERAALIGAGLDEGTASFVVALNGNIRDGLLSETSGKLAELIGRPTTPLIETMRTWAA